MASEIMEWETLSQCIERECYVVGGEIRVRRAIVQAVAAAVRAPLEERVKELEAECSKEGLSERRALDEELQCADDAIEECGLGDRGDITAADAIRRVTADRDTLRAQLAEAVARNETLVTLRQLLGTDDVVGAVRELAAERITDRVLAAWLFDRAEQYENESATRAAFDDLIGAVEEGEYRAAFAHGELDDLLVKRPIPMVLFCPECGAQHIDAPDPERGWENPPHKSHLCHACATVWRPADVPTNGVLSVSRGSRDNWTPTREAHVATPDPSPTSG